MNRLTTEVVAQVRRRYGISLRIEELGSNCTALTGVLEGGAVLVVSDGNFGHDLGDFEYFAAASFHPSLQHWGDSANEPTRHYASQEVFSAADVLDLIERVLH